MAISILGYNAGTQGGWGPISQSYTAPAGATYLAVSVACSSYGGVPTVSWNGVNCSLKQAYGGSSGVWGLAGPDIGTYTFSTTNVGDRGSAWSLAWLKDVDLASPVRTTGTSANPGASFNVTGWISGDFVQYSAYSYWDGDGYGISGTGFNFRSQYYSGYGQCASCGDGTLTGSSPLTLSLSGNVVDNWHGWVVFAQSTAVGGGPSLVTQGLSTYGPFPDGRQSYRRSRDRNAYY